MLAINREPIYRNKLFLSSLAVIIGFGLTVGLLRAVAPANTQTNQSAQTRSSDRASGLIPIKTDESESRSESGNGGTANSDNTTPTGLPETSSQTASSGS